MENSYKKTLTLGEPKELIDLYYKIELLSLIRGIIYEHYLNKGLL